MMTFKPDVPVLTNHEALLILQRSNGSHSKIEHIYHEIGQLIRDRRKQLGMSQGTLAACVDISRPSVVNIEAGRQRVAVHQLYDFAQVLRTSPAMLAPKPFWVQRDFIFIRK